MSALTPEQFKSLSSSARSDVLEIEIEYSLRLLEMSKEHDFRSEDAEEIKQRSDKHASRWKQIVEERDNKIQLIVERDHANR